MCGNSKALGIREVNVKPFKFIPRFSINLLELNPFNKTLQLLKCINFFFQTYF